MQLKKLRRDLFLLVTLTAIITTGCSNFTVEKTPVNYVAQEDFTLPYIAGEVEIQEQTTEAALNIENSIQEAEAEVEAVKKEVSLVMVGDVLLHTRVQDSGVMEDGSYNYDHMFANVKSDIESADLALVNQEVILGGREIGLSGYPNFNGAYEVGDSLVDTGFDVILHATNHALDKGTTGLLNCKSFWNTKYPEIGVVGIHESEEDDQIIFVREVNGIKIAILNYTYGTNGIKLPSDMPYAVELWNNEKVAADVNLAKTVADFVVVCPHWGTEYVLNETKEQRDKAQFLADLGVDLIIGTHPHVVEPVEVITGVNGNETLVYYSIGNFINATSGTGKGTSNRMVGVMAKVNIQMNEDNNAFISEYGIEPLVSHLVTGRGNMTTYKLSDYTEELANANQIKKQDSEFSLEYCKDLCRKVFKDLYVE